MKISSCSYGMRKENKSYLSVSVSNTLTCLLKASKATCFCDTIWPSSFSYPFFHYSPTCSFLHTTALMIFWLQLYQEWTPSYIKLGAPNSTKALFTDAKQMSLSLLSISCAYGSTQNKRWLMIKTEENWLTSQKLFFVLIMMSSSMCSPL